MGCGSLIALNDDILWTGYTIPKHEHKDLDILGYMIEGELEHWDTTGVLGRATPGKIQHMWCGSGIWHTEKCVSPTPARYLQIWITPEEKNSVPYYELINKSPEFGQINVKLKSNITISAGILNSTYTSSKGYIYIISGGCFVDGVGLYEGDGAELTETTTIESESAHIILFENT
jgi:redox-sensitive bicupin YhaK (pirin superfamily)